MKGSIAGIATLAFPCLVVTEPLEASPTRSGVVEAPQDVIALEAGIWDATIMSPDGKRLLATGVQTNQPRSAGLWMLNQMSVDGGRYEGTGIWGFDRLSGRYSGTWVDNGQSHPRHDEGYWDAATQTMTWWSTVRRKDGGTQRIRATSTFAGNSRTYRSYEVGPGGERPLSLVLFVKRPAGPGR